MNNKLIYDSLSNALYFFHFDEKEMVFSIYIRSVIMPKLEEMAQISQLITDQNYIKSFDGQHGINGCVKVERGYGNFTKLFFRLVPIYEVTKKKCKQCGGDGKTFEGENYPCWRCHGNGKELVIQWDPLSKIMDTVSSVLHLLEGYILLCTGNKELLSLYPDQLYVITTSTIGDMGGYALGGTNSDFFKQKLIKFYEKEKIENRLQKSIGGNLAVMEESWKKMFEAYKFMDVSPNSDEYRLSEIHIIIRPNGSFQIQTEGQNSCSIFNPPERGHITFWIGSGGISIDCHNVDTPMQQLDLLIGLAGMTEEIFM